MIDLRIDFKDSRIDLLKINYFNFLMERRRLLEMRCLLNCLKMKGIIWNLKKKILNLKTK